MSLIDDGHKLDVVKVVCLEVCLEVVVMVEVRFVDESGAETAQQFGESCTHHFVLPLSLRVVKTHELPHHQLFVWILFWRFLEVEGDNESLALLLAKLFVHQD